MENLVLYRGDSDDRLINNAESIRKLRQRLTERQLCTNLISGGNGQDAFTKDMLYRVKMHIFPEEEKKFTHFLSFSEKENIAFHFGAKTHESTIGKISLEDCINLDYIEEEYDTNDFDFALIKLEIKNFKDIIEKEKGVYEYLYDSNNIKFPKSNILLIDTVTYLDNNRNNTEDHLIIAKKEKEWLILPQNMELLNNNKYEYSAILPMGKVFNFKKYRVKDTNLTNMTLKDFL